jgi:glycerol-3-phosphate acyltransferase PlsY
VEIVVCLITALAAYLLGSIPTGYLAGRAKGIDIRQAGSGNIGATNAFRILGKPAGMIVLLVDALKGWLAVAVVPGLIFPLFFSTAVSERGLTVDYLKIIGIVVILGHNYPCWLKFKGGKGIATSGGVLVALVWPAFLISLAVWILVCLITRYVSLASIMGALALPIATWLTHYPLHLIAITALMSALAIYKHKANIGRLMNGTENKVGRKKGPPGNGAAP